MMAPLRVLAVATMIAAMASSARAASPRRVFVDAGARTAALAQILVDEGVTLASPDAAEARVVLRAAGATWTLEILDRRGARVLRRDIGAAGGELASLRVTALLVSRTVRTGRWPDAPPPPTRTATATAAALSAGAVVPAAGREPAGDVRALPSTPVAPTAASLIASASALPRSATVAFGGDPADTPDGPRLGVRTRAGRAGAAEAGAAEAGAAEAGAAEAGAAEPGADDGAREGRRAAGQDAARTRGDAPSGDGAGAADATQAGAGGARGDSADAEGRARADRQGGPARDAARPAADASADDDARDPGPDGARGVPTVAAPRLPAAPDGGEADAEPDDASPLAELEASPRRRPVAIEDSPLDARFGLIPMSDAETRWRGVVTLGARWWDVGAAPTLAVGLGAEHPAGPVYLGAQLRVAGLFCCERADAGVVATVYELGAAGYTLVPLVRWAQAAALMLSGELAADVMLGTASITPEVDGSQGTPTDLQGFSLTAAVGPSLELRPSTGWAIRVRGSVRFSLAVYEIARADASDALSSGWVHPYIDLAIPIGL